MEHWANSSRHSTAQPVGVPLTALHPKLFRLGECASAAGAERAVPTGYAALDRELPGGGWPLGGLVEIGLDAQGIGELSLVLGNSSNRVARGELWILPSAPNAHAPWIPYAPGLVAQGVDPARLAIVQPAGCDEALWCAEQGLRSGALHRVLWWQGGAACASLALRRLQQAAASGGTTMFAFRPLAQLNQPSPAVLRLGLEARVGGRLQVRLIKRRGLPDGKTITLVLRDWFCLRQSAPQPTHDGAERPWLAGLAPSAAR
jgi:cell division inhibitor SulA/protein ImuA